MSKLRDSRFKNERFDFFWRIFRDCQKWVNERFHSVFWFSIAEHGCDWSESIRRAGNLNGLVESLGLWPGSTWTPVERCLGAGRLVWPTGADTRRKHARRNVARFVPCYYTYLLTMYISYLTVHVQHSCSWGPTTTEVSSDTVLYRMSLKSSLALWAIGSWKSEEKSPRPCFSPMHGCWDIDRLVRQPIGSAGNKRHSPTPRPQSTVNFDRRYLNNRASQREIHGDFSLQNFAIYKVARPDLNFATLCIFK